MRPALSLLALLVACLLAPAAASAHELLVLPVGSGELDAGLADPARLVHATLDAPADELVVTVRASGSPLELLLLVPDRRPERTQSGEERPTLTVTGAGAGIDTTTPERRETLVDEGTAVAYRVIGTTTAAVAAGTRLRIVIRRGSEPARVAVRGGGPPTVDAPDTESTPRPRVHPRGWVETPAPSAKVDRSPPKTTSRPIVAIYGAGIALLGVLLGVWWVWSGRRRSRERGAERAADERRT